MCGSFNVLSHVMQESLKGQEVSSEPSYCYIIGELIAVLPLSINLRLHLEVWLDANGGFILFDVLCVRVALVASEIFDRLEDCGRCTAVGEDHVFEVEELFLEGIRRALFIVVRLVDILCHVSIHDLRYVSWYLLIELFNLFPLYHLEF